jgi:hexosaminidase
MCPHLYCYLDYPTGEKDDRCPYPLFCHKENRLLPLEKVYSFDPCEGIPHGQRKYVIGSQSLNWTESTWRVADLEYKMWPRTCASAEVLWTGPGKRTFEDFRDRLERCNLKR